MSESSSPPAPKNLRELARPIRSLHEHVPVHDINDHRLILAVNEERYPWHEHPDSDELFLVVDGSLRLEFADGAFVDLGPWDTWVVPAGTPHRTTPQDRCVNLVFEIAGAKTRFLEDEPAAAARRGDRLHRPEVDET